MPILRQAATILFEMVNDDIGASLANMLARVESVELGNCLTELAQAGQAKGNFEWRLTGALDAIERHQARKKRSIIESEEDESERLRKLSESTDKVNLRKMGMI